MPTSPIPGPLGCGCAPGPSRALLWSCSLGSWGTSVTAGGLSGDSPIPALAFRGKQDDLAQHCLAHGNLESQEGINRAHTSYRAPRDCRLERMKAALVALLREAFSSRQDETQLPVPFRSPEGTSPLHWWYGWHRDLALDVTLGMPRWFYQQGAALCITDAETTHLLSLLACRCL